MSDDDIDIATWKPPRPDFSKPPAPGNEGWRREDVQALAMTDNPLEATPLHEALEELKSYYADPMADHSPEMMVHMLGAVVTAIPDNIEAITADLAEARAALERERNDRKEQVRRKRATHEYADRFKVERDEARAILRRVEPYILDRPLLVRAVRLATHPDAKQEVGDG